MEIEFNQSASASIPLFRRFTFNKLRGICLSALCFGGGGLDFCASIHQMCLIVTHNG